MGTHPSQVSKALDESDRRRATGLRRSLDPKRLLQMELRTRHLSERAVCIPDRPLEVGKHLGLARQAVLDLQARRIQHVSDTHVTPARLIGRDGHEHVAKERVDLLRLRCLDLRAMAGPTFRGRKQRQRYDGGDQHQRERTRQHHGNAMPRVQLAQLVDRAGGRAAMG